ncbi:MAG: hypothetical protein LBU57_10390 [Dysgonamonadaceae bacterium]|jgi:hypothetical protein|nr:hypothetical protein [Dysgonamonadaceae bacterium]
MIGILLGIVAIYFGINAIGQSQVDLISTAFLLGLVILVFQGLITNIYFSELSSKPQTLSMLLLPASKLEKFTTKSLYCLVIFPIIFALYYWLVLNLTVAYNSWASDVFNLPDRNVVDLMSLNSVFSNKNDILFTAVSIWFFAATLFICGVQMFKKSAHIKIFLVYIAFMFLAAYLTKFFYFLISGHSSDTVVFPFLFITEKGGGSYSLVDDFSFYPQYLCIFIGLYLLVVSWFKFNEKTV